MPGHTLKSCDTVPHATDYGVTKGSQRIQKYDGGQNGFDPFGVKFIQR